MIDYSSLYDPKNPFSKYWSEYEKILPDYGNKIIKIKFNDFKEKYFNNKDTFDKKELIFENFSFPLNDRQFENHIDQLNFYLLLLDQDFQLFS